MAKLKCGLIQMALKGDTTMEPVEIRDRMIEAHIPYIESALSWEPGPRDEVSWWDGGSFHENLRNSNGLKAQPRREADLSNSPDWLVEFYETCRPHYEHLRQFRIQHS